MARSREVLAWSALLTSFGACVALAISLPLAVRGFVNDSTDPAPLSLDVQQGTALLQRPALSDVAGVTDRTFDVPDGSVIKADQSTQASLTVRDRRTDANLVIVQLYGNTELTVQRAATPRFDASPNPNVVDLAVSTGRIRVNVLPDTARATAVTIRSPQGAVSLHSGTYAVEVTNEELQVTVREGTAVVQAQDRSVLIEPSQRARVLLGQPPEGGLSGERQLIADGSFNQPLAPSWTIEHGPQNPDEALGIINPAIIAGRRAAVFDRRGPSHAETRLVQNVNRDVTDAASLTLHFAVLVTTQDVPVCGQLGSECPLMVRIDYRDTGGAAREWLQGFYSVPNSPDVNNPTYCQTCATPNPHQRIALNTWFTYDSGNLMDLLAVDGMKPARITRVTFYASGHTYRSAVTDVELLMQD